MRKILVAALAALSVFASTATAAQACTLGASYESYVYCTANPGAILVTYTCVDGYVWRGTGWRVLWGCGG